MINPPEQERTNDRLRLEVKKVLPRVIKLRHRLHQIPEASFQEKKTGELIRRELLSMNLDPEPVAQTGITATLSGKHSGNTLALRADMDALAITELTGKTYTSQHPGYAHSCGHDGHMACVLGAARVLNELKDQLFGKVKIIFQPAEEIGRGANAIITAGALGNPLPAAIFALHAWPGIPCKTLASRPGMITAGNDLFTITITGKGGHGARPHESNNPILTASRIACEISSLAETKKERRPLYTISVGILQGGTQPNTIPDTALLQGTLRSADPDIRQKMITRISDRVKMLCEKCGSHANIQFQTYCPPVLNNPDLYQLFSSAAKELLGPENVKKLSTHSMGSEDFGCYTEKIPGLLIRLGMGTQSPTLHTSEFDFSDDALETGITILSGLALRAGQPDCHIRNNA